MERRCDELTREVGLPGVPPLRYGLTAWAMVMRDGDYTPQAMGAAMRQHRYDVQAVLYLLALHRLLPQFFIQAHLRNAMDVAQVLLQFYVGMVVYPALEGGQDLLLGQAGVVGQDAHDGDDAHDGHDDELLGVHVSLQARNQLPAESRETAAPSSTARTARASASRARTGRTGRSSSTPRPPSPVSTPPTSPSPKASPTSSRPASF